MGWKAINIGTLVLVQTESCFFDEHGFGFAVLFIARDAAPGRPSVLVESKPIHGAYRVVRAERFHCFARR